MYIMTKMRIKIKIIKLFEWSLYKLNLSFPFSIQLMNHLILTKSFNEISSTRRSQRRKHKLPKLKRSQYSIPNPYRQENPQHCLPHHLQRQLVQYENISAKSLQQIKYNSNNMQQDMGDVLSKMKNAVRRQEQELLNLVNCRRQIDEYSFSQINGGQDNKREDMLMEEELENESVESIFSDQYGSDQLVFYSDNHIPNNPIKDDYQNYLL